MNWRYTFFDGEKSCVTIQIEAMEIPSFPFLVLSFGNQRSSMSIFLGLALQSLCPPFPEVELSSSGTVECYSLHCCAAAFSIFGS